MNISDPIFTMKGATVKKVILRFFLAVVPFVTPKNFNLNRPPLHVFCPYLLDFWQWRYFSFFILAMALVRILYLLNGWNVEEIDSVSAELQWQFLSPGLINLYFLLWESRDYLRPCSDRQPVSVNDSLRFLSRKAILISFSGKRTAANLFQNHFEFGKSLGAMDEKLDNRPTS